MMQELQPNAAASFKDVKFNVRIEALNTEEKLDILSNHFLKLEHSYLREIHRIPQIRPEAKIMFLTGGPKSDVTEARDFDGNLIHTRHLNHPRPMVAEIPEAINAISHWFDQLVNIHHLDGKKPSIIPILSEVSDTVYNISHLIALDVDFSEDYNSYLRRIAGSLGYDLDTLLAITMYKYNYRLGQGGSQKNYEQENLILQSLLNQTNAEGKPKIHTPNETQLQKTFHTLSEIQMQLNTRLIQLEQKHAWKKDSSMPQSPSSYS